MLMAKIDFVKSQGLGNDFIIIEDLNGQLEITADMVVAACDRHFGIGADGLIILKKSAAADYYMDFRNADGSTAQMCGNGIRVLAQYVFEHIGPQSIMKLETGAGVKSVELMTADGLVDEIKVDMGEPVFTPMRIPMLAEGDDFIDRQVDFTGGAVSMTCLSMGNPHGVIFVDDIDEADVDTVGPAIESLDIFPERVNVEFVQVVSADSLRARVWERGVGETLACGTGACAALVAAASNALTGRSAQVVLPGGRLRVTWSENNHITLAGGAREVFTGRLDTEDWPTQGEMD